ncbi:hypothetical protein VFPBJ_06857 [Purpureocillium lilacinum]|uniref:Uncharacterized protein n=1 Tax=Purpureocillium lilacinum TaxID=33203 RepID=A0A179GLH5_PURLI|nr:hypothetical protein VFPBJ_06857 [Purpureocillium lilacinum]
MLAGPSEERAVGAWCKASTDDEHLQPQDVGAIMTHTSKRQWTSLTHRVTTRLAPLKARISTRCRDSVPPPTLPGFPYLASKLNGLESCRPG